MRRPRSMGARANGAVWSRFQVQVFASIFPLEICSMSAEVLVCRFNRPSLAMAPSSVNDDTKTSRGCSPQGDSSLDRIASLAEDDPKPSMLTSIFVRAARCIQERSHHAQKNHSSLAPLRSPRACRRGVVYELGSNSPDRPIFRQQLGYSAICPGSYISIRGGRRPASISLQPFRPALFCQPQSCPAFRSQHQGDLQSIRHATACAGLLGRPRQSFAAHLVLYS